MSEVVRQISERLVAKGHEVTVATSRHPERQGDTINGVKVVSFSVSGKGAMRIFGDADLYKRFLLDSSFDVITNFAAQQWATDLMLPILDRIKSKKVFVPTGFSALGDPAFADYFESMRSWIKQYDACVFLSDKYRDIEFSRSAEASNQAIIPNAAAADEFDRPATGEIKERLGIPPEHNLIIHVAGYLSVAKGQVEAVRIFGESEVRDTTLLLICGEFAAGLLAGLRPRNLARGAWQMLRGRGLSGLLPSWQIAAWRRLYQKRNRRFGRRVLTASLSREETVDCFLCADAFLFPSWIECSPLVLFEAAASGTPFLVTDVGNAREIISWTGGGEILPGRRLNDREGSVLADVHAGARMLNSLWSDPKRRAEMASTARKAWRERFTWEKIADRYEELYQALVSGESVAGRFPAPPTIAPVS
jgi:glycosyltransferase involved in cell wall biosynthesis